LDTIIELTIKAFNASRATIFVLDEKSNELYSIAGTGLRKQELRFPRNLGIAGEVVTRGISIMSDNPDNHSSFNRQFDLQTGFKTKNIICVPLKDRTGRIVGVFEVLNKLNDKFSAEDEIYLGSIAANTVIIIENHSLDNKIVELQKETDKLYEKFYQAQKKIISDTKNSTVAEIDKFVNEIKQYDAIPKLLTKLRSVSGTNQDLILLADRISESQKKLFNRLEQYIKQFKDQV